MVNATHGLTVTVERPAGRDEYDDPIATQPATHEIEGCLVAPRTSDELGGEITVRGRAGVIVGLWLYAPPGADIERADRIVIPAGAPNAGRYEIDGEPAEWVSPHSGKPRGVQVALRRTEG